MDVVHTRKAVQVISQYVIYFVSMQPFVKISAGCKHSLVALLGAHVHLLIRALYPCYQVMFTFGEPVSAVVPDFFSWLIEAQPNAVICCCSPSSSCYVLCIPIGFFAHHGCKE